MSEMVERDPLEKALEAFTQDADSLGRLVLREFDNGVRAIPKGKADPDIDPASFKRFLIEYRHCWWGQTLKRQAVRNGGSRARTF